MYKVYLKPGKEESLKRFHPWVFSGAIAHFDGEPEEGEVVEIYTSKKEFIAKGHFQIGSIAVRVLSFYQDKAIDADFWKRKLSIAYDMRRSIGIVFQDYQLLSDRDVFGNLHYVMKATGWKNETDMRKRIEEVLSVVGLENKAFKMPFELSGGQQQRLAVARALVNNPRVILADEPTGNLDPWAAEDIMEVFRRIVAGGCSIVMSTHNIANIEQFPARTIRFNKGKVEEIDISSVLGA